MLGRRNPIRNLITFGFTLMLLYMLWQKLHIVLWVRIEWWQLLLLIVGLIVALDLMLDALLGKRW